MNACVVGGDLRVPILGVIAILRFLTFRFEHDDVDDGKLKVLFPPSVMLALTPINISPIVEWERFIWLSITCLYHHTNPCHIRAMKRGGCELSVGLFVEHVSLLFFAEGSDGFFFGWKLVGGHEGDAEGEVHVDFVVLLTVWYGILRRGVVLFSLSLSR